ncbi:YadA-like family protein [Paraburkholderia sp. Tr-20389]|uniref:YadA-like family protein n=1 Tax=Paraburkholderia sp. Tr-20389 TaxID=2703903 RepID=UPI00321713EF
MANSATLGTAGFTPVGGTAIAAATAAGGEVSVGSAGAERRITNVAAGLNPTDAVNVSQLMSEDAKVNNVSSNVSNVSNNLSNLGNNVTNINNQVTNIVNGGGIKYFHANSTLADSSATGANSVAAGPASVASASNAVAMGNGASATTANSVALGSNSVANSATLGTAGFTPVGGTAIAAATAAGGEVSVGAAGAERRITNVAAGLNPTDAVNVSQLTSEDAKVNNVSNNVSNVSNNLSNLGNNVTNINNQVTNIVNGGGIKYFHANSTLADSVATGTDAVAIGGNASATTANSVALGSNSMANSTTLGTAGFQPVGGTAIAAATAAGGEVSVGAAGAERRITNVAAGLNPTDAVNVSQLMSEDAKVNNVSNNVSNVANNLSNLGNNVTNINNQVTNIVNGGGIKYFHANSTLADSVATGTDAVAIGGNASATTANSVALGSNSVANSATLGTAGFNPGGAAISAATAAGGEVSVGAAGAERRITNVAAGYSATDAVNVSQLMSEDAKVNNVGTSISNVIGGGTTYDASTGTITGPTFNIGGSTVTTIAGAITNLDGRVTQNTTDISNITNQINNGTIGLVQQDPTTRNITVAKDTDGTLVDFTGTAGVRKLTGVANGDVNATSVDAVNGSQLYNVAQSTANSLGGGSTVNSDGTISNPTYVINGGNTTATNVGDAITNIDGRVTNIDNTVTNIVNGGGIKYFHANSTLADSVATGTDAVAIGGNASATAANSVALGANTTTTADLTAAAYNPGSSTLSGTTPVGEVSVGSAGNERRLTNVAAGSAATDAVNVSQLMSEDAKVNNVGTSISNVIGGGTTYDASTGTITGPTFNIGGSTVTTIAGAITNLDGRVTQNTTDISNITNQINNGTIGLVQQDPTTRNITVAKDTDGTLVDFTGTAGVRKLTGVANGDVNATSVDAVNGSQLYNVAQSTANSLGGASTVNSDGTVSNPTYVINGGNTTATNVGDAITNIDGRVTQNTTDISNVTNQINNGTIGLVQQDPTTRNITVAKDTDGTLVDFTGTAGVRKLTGVANGDVNATSVDAVNGSQLYNVAQSTANSLGGGSTVNSDGTVSNPTYVINGGNTTATNVGDAITNIDGRVTNIDNTVTNIVNGGGIKYFHANSTLADSVATGTDAVAIGGNASATTANSVALGSNSVANSTTLGTAGFNPGGAAISAATAAGGEVSVGAAGTERRITNVAAGYSATDAVNVSQLMSEDAKVNNVGTSISNVIGGGTTYDASTGTITGPTFNIGGSTVTTIAGAITNLDGRVTQNTTDISNITNQINNGTIGLVQQDPTTRNITVAKDTDGTLVDFTGTAGVRKLTGVANGDVNATSVDAVNGSQLYNVAQSTANSLGGGSTVNSDGTVSNPTYVINGGNTTATNVGDAITNIDGRVTQNTTDISNVTNQINNGTIGLVQQDPTTRNITVAKDTDGTLVDFTGTAGVRKLTGVANGDVNATSVDAVNGSQLYNVSQSTANAIGGGSTVNSDGTISNPTYVINGGNTTATNVGDAITNIDGRVTQNTSDIANLNTDVTNINSVLNNINNGAGITYFHANSSLVDSQALGAESIAIGGAAVAQGANSIAIGSNASASAANSVALGQGSVADRANSVSVGSAGNERQITNVAAGTADTDAVNVSQLKAAGIINGDGTTKTAVTYDTNPDGTTNFSSITVGGGNAPDGTTIHNVAAGTDGTDAVNVNQLNDAISNVTNIANNAVDPMFTANGDRNTEQASASGSHATAMGPTANASGNQSIAGGYNAQASGDSSIAMGANSKATADHAVALGDGSVADRANTVSVGSAGNERQITNVAAGTQTTDAVNVGQLNAAVANAVGDLPTGTTVKQYTDQQINMVQQGVNSVARNAYSGVAAATALTMIPDVDQGKTIAVGIGSGSYHGYQAAALGASARITENIKIKLGAGISAQGTTVGAGASYQW